MATNSHTRTSPRTRQHIHHRRLAWRHSTLIVVGLASVLATIAPLHAENPIPIGRSNYDDASENVFLKNELTFITVTMEPSDLQDCLNDPFSDEYKTCSVRIVNSVIDETVENVGIRPRGNTSRSALKKSWKLRFNVFVLGREFHGLEKMNINGEHNDVSIIRSRLAWELFKEMGVPSPRASHVHFKINDGALVEGVHINVEQIDDEFVDNWFDNDEGNLYKCLYQGNKANLKYVSPGTPETYQNLGGGETYQEEINEDAPDYTDLAGFIDFINNTDDAIFAAGIVDRFSVDNFLRSMAVDVTIGQWDNYWYGANNYYLYHNQDTDRFEYLPYDYDNTYGIDFFGIDWARRPYDTWGDGGYGGEPGSGGDGVVSIDPDPAVADQDVTISYDPTGRPLEGVGYVQLHYGLNGWDPVITPDAPMSWNATEELWQVTVPLPAGTWQLDFVFNDGAGTWDNNSGQDWHLAVTSGSREGGPRSWQYPPLIDRLLAIPAYEEQFRRYLLELANGPFSLAETEAGIDATKAMIAPYAFEGSYDNGNMDYGYTTADFNDSYTLPTDYRNWGWGWDWGLKPFIQTRAADLLVTVPAPTPLPRLIVNEILAGNNTINQDEMGQYEDWVEIYNDETSPVVMDGMYLTDDPGDPKKWQVPAGTTIPAKGFLLVWCDNDPTDGPLHATFKLSGDGEGVGIFHNDANGNVLIDYAAYPAIRGDVSYGLYPDGIGTWGFMATPTPGSANNPHNAPPTITSTSHDPSEPTSLESVWVTSIVTDDGAVTNVEIVYDAGSGPVTLVMHDDGLHHDESAGDDVYGAEIAAQLPSTNVTYCIRATDDESAVYTDPAEAPGETFGYIVDYGAPQIVINEFMADNDGVIEDPDEAGEYADWIELYNVGDIPINLVNMCLTDDLADPTQFIIPADLWLLPGETILFWADDDTEQGPSHTNFKLGKSGEQIGLFDTLASGNIEIDAITFGEQQTDIAFGRYPDGSDNWGIMMVPTPGESNGIRGDLDCTQNVDVDDIGPFVLALTDPDVYTAAHPTCGVFLADVNGDGMQDGRDVQVFIGLLLPE